jgi:uncharacterized protein (DUF488 family)
MALAAGSVPGKAVNKMDKRLLFTVGHSTRTWKDFVLLLKTWKIQELVDVRTIPRSRAFPWFEKIYMQSALPKAGIAYCHLAALGGLRHSKKDSMNTGWRNASFRGYADYMQTVDFENGLKDLNRRRRRHRVCVMCSEAVWWRCHRRMIADAEIIRGIPVRHIMTEQLATPHELTPFARVCRKQTRKPVITYPSS